MPQKQTPKNPQRIDSKLTELSRRSFLAHSAATASLALTAQAKPTTPKMKIGVSTLGFGRLTNAEVAREFASVGVKITQLFLRMKDSNFWRYNDRNDLSTLTPTRCREIVAPYRDADIELHSLGVYTNLIHPDDAEQQANLEYFERNIEVGLQMGITCFVTESGHYQAPDTPAKRVSLEFQDDSWTRMIEVGHKLAAMAEKHDAQILIEPSHISFFTSAKRTRDYLEEVGSPRIRALLDAANISEVNSLEEMFQQLSPWIECIHAKDRKLHISKGVAAGKGDINYKEYVTLAYKYNPKAPMLLEYVDPDDYKEALAHLKNALREANIPWQ